MLSRISLPSRVLQNPSINTGDPVLDPASPSLLLLHNASSENADPIPQRKVTHLTGGKTAGHYGKKKVLQV
jgi:hypothetical protein